MQQTLEVSTRGLELPLSRARENTLKRLVGLQPLLVAHLVPHTTSPSPHAHTHTSATFPSRMRTRAGSILKPGWLRRKRSHTFSHKTKPSTSTSSSSSSSTITDRFTHFLKHSSSHIKPHPLAKHIVNTDVCVSVCV